MSRKRVDYEGDACRGCGCGVRKRETKKKKVKKGQEYWFKWYLYCPNCHRIYHKNAARRLIVNGIRVDVPIPKFDSETEQRKCES